MGFVKKIAKPLAKAVTGNIGGAIGDVVGGLGKGVGAARQESFDPYQFNEEAFRLNEQDAGRSTGFIDQLEGQVGGYDPLVNRLAAQARGEGESMAALQLQEATDRNLAQQVGTAAGNRTINPALAAKMAAENMGAINQQAAGQAGQLRLQEMLQAQNQEMAARQAQSSATGIGGNMAMQFGENNRGAAMDLERMRGQQVLGGANVDTSRFNANEQRIGNFASNLGAGLGGVTSGLKEGGQDVAKAFKASRAKRKNKKSAFAGQLGMDTVA